MRQARAHFVRCGYTGASLSEILSAAEFPRSSFYYFFGSKATLFEASFSDGLTRLAERVRVPDVDSLDAESFWPSILAFLDDLEEAGADQDISTIPRLSICRTLRNAPPASSSAGRPGRGASTLSAPGGRWACSIAKSP